MDYKKIYNDLVKSRQALCRQRIKGINDDWEDHHFFPKCWGGSNDRENMVLLTYEEHFLAHKLLIECYKDDAAKKGDMSYALWMMSNTNPKGRIRNCSMRDYGYARREYVMTLRGKSPWNKGKKGVQVAWNKGKEWSPEVKVKFKKSKELNPVWNKGKTMETEPGLKVISEKSQRNRSRTGMTNSPELRQKTTEWNNNLTDDERRERSEKLSKAALGKPKPWLRGRPISDEVRANISKAKAATPKKICQLCGKEFTVQNISKHLKKCLSTPTL